MAGILFEFFKRDANCSGGLLHEMAHQSVGDMRDTHHGCGGQVLVVRLSEDRINQPIECHMCSVGCQEAAASLACPGPKQRYRRDHCLK
jgi:hypothetical protein